MNDIPRFPTSQRIIEARSHWRYNGSARPEFAQDPEPNQESVWDFPRPPRIEAVGQRLRVYMGNQLVADSVDGVRVVETAGAPTYYFPPTDVDDHAIAYGEIVSVCEWKGAAQTIRVGDLGNAGWRYVQMFEAFDPIYLWPSFYPKTLRCMVGDEIALPQPGGYYGGWVTANLTGPIKGEPGSGYW